MYNTIHKTIYTYKYIILYRNILTFALSHTHIFGLFVGSYVEKKKKRFFFIFGVVRCARRFVDGEFMCFYSFCLFARFLICFFFVRSLCYTFVCFSLFFEFSRRRCLRAILLCVKLFISFPFSLLLFELFISIDPYVYAFSVHIPSFVVYAYVPFTCIDVVVDFVFFLLFLAVVAFLSFSAFFRIGSPVFLCFEYAICRTPLLFL